MFISRIRKTRLYNSKTGLICHLLIYAPSGRRLNYRTNGVKMVLTRDVVMTTVLQLIFMHVDKIDSITQGVTACPTPYDRSFRSCISG